MFGAWAMRGLGGLLLLAAALKMYGLAVEPVGRAGIFSEPWLQTALVEWELILGLWLVAGLYRKQSWFAAVACGVAFLDVSLYQGFRGETSCGCFGRLSVSPWYTACLDAMALALLMWCKPDRLNSPVPSRSRSRLTVFVALLALLAIPGAWLTARNAHAGLSSDGEVVGTGRSVVLRPATWVGQEFPLRKQLDIGEELSQGQWVVILFHRNCASCMKIIAKFERDAQMSGASEHPPRMALIEVPDQDAPGSNAPAVRTAFRSGRLNESWNWLVTTPVVVRLKDGHVIGVLE